MIKYQLERIKDMYSGISDPDRLDGIPVVTVAQSDIEWLIEQAGRVQELEEDLTKYRNGFEFQLLINNSIKKQNKRYREAIRECIERMNAGGAGTRSFVYEKLSKALEDKE